MLGVKAAEGFTYDDLVKAKERFVDTELIDLRDLLDEKKCEDAKPAYVLVVRNGIDQLGKELGFSAD